MIFPIPLFMHAPTRRFIIPPTPDFLVTLQVNGWIVPVSGKLENTANKGDTLSFYIHGEQFDVDAPPRIDKVVTKKEMKDGTEAVVTFEPWVSRV